MKKLLSVTFFTALLTAMRMLAGFVTAKVVAIYAGPSGIALLGQLQNLVTGLAGIVNSPLGSSIVRFTAEHDANGYDACSAWWKVSLRWVMVFFIIIIPIMGIYSQTVSFWLFGTDEYDWLIIITVLMLPFAAIGTLVNSVLNGQQKYKQYVTLGMVSVIISTSAMLILSINYGLKGALIAAAIQNGLIGAALLIFAIRKPWFRLKFWWGSLDPAKVKIVGGYILMAVTSAIMAPLSMILIRKIMVDHVGWEVTGYWQSVWKISEAYLAVVTLSLSTYFFPQLSKLKTYIEIKREINNTAVIIMPIVIIMALGIYFLRDLAITILFTENFRPARDLFAIQLVGDVFKILSWLYSYSMLSRGAVRWYVSSEIFFALFLTSLCWYFIPVYGAHGANIAYCVTYALYMVFAISNLKRFSSFKVQTKDK